MVPLVSNALRRLAGALLITLCLAGTAAAERPVATIEFKAWRFAVLFGWQWGSGELILADGTTYPILVHGLDFVSFGLGKYEARGAVYRMDDVSSFPGTYGGVEAGASIIEGIAGIHLQNDRGVTIVIEAAQSGYLLQLGPKGLVILFDN